MMKRATWTLIFAGILGSGLGLHLVVTRPLHQRVDRLTAELDELQSGIRLLAGSRDEVAYANDLLSSLQNQSQRLDQARAALDNVRMLEQEVRQHSVRAVEASASLADIGDLQSNVIAQSERLDAMNNTLDQLVLYQARAEDLALATSDQQTTLELAEESLKQLASFHDQIVSEADGIDTAEKRFTQLVDLKDSARQVAQTDIEVARTRLSGLSELQQGLLNSGERTPAAREVSTQLIALQDDLVAQGARADIAGKHAAQLLNLEKTLADDAEQGIDSAVTNLATLLEIEEQLATQDGQLALAIESLELMEDLQDEFHRRTQDMENIRRGLTELVMMESLVARTVRSLQPLTELADLRRLDAGQIRAIAQSLLDQPVERMAMHDSEAIDADDSGVTPIEEELVPLPPTLR